MYAYNAALWCDSCGKAIKDELDKQGAGDNGSTDDYPREDGTGRSFAKLHT